jgi:hypothetical protein
MRHLTHRTADSLTRHALLSVLVATAAAVPASAVAQRPAGAMPPVRATRHDSDTMAQMSVIHELVMNHDRVTRTVTNLPNGTRIVTESSDPQVARMLKDHVATMGTRLEQGSDPGLPIESPALRTLFRNRAKITTHADTTATGVIVVQTSDDSETVAALQKHAGEVSDLVREGMPALHRAMAAPTGGGMTHAGMMQRDADSAFAAMQRRGADARAMGVDQYTSVHQFDALPDGGRIELQRDVDDSAGVAQIRKHLREIAAAFKQGDFRTPAFVHDHQVPGTIVMAAKREAITYTVHDLPRGGEVRIVTHDSEALAAIHEFIAFQRHDHHAGGRSMPKRPRPEQPALRAEVLGRRWRTGVLPKLGVVGSSPIARSGSI